MATPLKTRNSETLHSFDRIPEDRGKSSTILIIDDDPTAIKRLRLLCENISSETERLILSASNLQEAFELVSKNQIHVILLDKDLQFNNSTVENGIHSIPQLIEATPGSQILIITASKSFDDCVEAMRLGASGFLPKSYPDDVIQAQIEKAIQVSQLTYTQLRQERSEVKERRDLRLPGSSPIIQSLYVKLQALSETNRPVLLTGETGVGKTTAAKIIHEKRKAYLKQGERPFLGINIAALNPNLVERELFGNERGAFTDAKDARPGFFELANGGTIFLDEIGEASLELQAKLLKVIDERVFFRLGGSKERSSSFKLICATNKNLEQMVKQGQFREDLYMRISTFNICLPSLPERPADIPEIIEAVLPKCCVENNIQVSMKEIPNSFIKYLTDYPPPGNIRGIERELALLFVYSKKDKRNRPVLTNWKKIPGLYSRHQKSVRAQNTLSLEELKSRPTEFLTDDFPGLFEFLSEMEDLVLLEASRNFSRQDAIAKLLKVSPSVVSKRLKTMKLKRKL